MCGSRCFGIEDKKSLVSLPAEISVPTSVRSSRSEHNDVPANLG